MSAHHGPPAPSIVIPAMATIGLLLIRLARKIGAWS